MVKFGGHIEAVRAGADPLGSELYLVPYNDIKGLVFAENANEFIERWHVSNDLFAWSCLTSEKEGIAN